MTETKRTSLEWARDIAHSYRWALLKADPETCAKLDAQAAAVGQRWLTPLRRVPTAAADESLNAEMSPADIEYFYGIPAGTLYGWVSKGLLTNRGKKGAPMYLVSEVFEVDGRRRKSA